MDKAEYAQKLKDPRWQKKRLKTLERDGWTCQFCFDSESTLHVHHKVYLPGTDPWDYPDELLITLCETCHEYEMQTLDFACAELTVAARYKFSSRNIHALALAIRDMPMLQIPDVVADAYTYALSNPKVQQEILRLFFEHLGSRQMPVVKKEG